MTRLTRSPSVALLGEAPPRVHVRPTETRANSWEDVADISASFGVYLDPWQELILQYAMGERADRTWAAKRVGVSVPRQNGKSQLLVARALAGALVFGERKIVISAHLQDTARESFSKLVEIIEADGNAALRQRIARNGVMNAINREQVKFTNGAVIQFKARSAAGGRGFSSDCLMLDEAQRLGRRAWVSINSTMSAMPNPQVWLLGTPPTPDDEGETFASIRNAALSGASNGLAYLEWSADPNDPEIPRIYLGQRRWSPEVERLCWSSNPAWHKRINRDVVQGEFESYSREEFSIDRWGIWPQDIGASRLISADEWKATEVRVAPDGVRSFGVAFSADGERQAVAGAVKHEAGVHVEAIGAQSGATDAGVQQLVQWFCTDPAQPERWRQAAQITISGRSHAAVLFEALRAAGVPAKVLRVASTAEYLTACSMLYDAVQDRTLSHPAAGDDDLFNRSVAVSDKKERTRDGGWGWQATTPDGDETPLEAASLALWGAKTSKRVPGRKAAVSF